ncbi:MAG: PPC domain-containing protein [Phycisphaerae bacterium]|nr:PPC domain-containing protein [Phycisphaerae bacterium]
MLARTLAVLCALQVATALAQSSPKEPHIGYVYPAGAQRGAVARILVGGQQLRGADAVYVSGEGVQATVIEHFPPLRNLDADQREALRERLRTLSEARLAELEREPGGLTPAGREFLRNLRNADRSAPRRAKNAAESEAKPVELPKHPLLCDLEEKSLRELQHIRNQFLNLKRGQPNAQIAESVLIEVTLDKDATIGDRELRLRTPRGLTNPMCFQVGLLAETRELEPNDPKPDGVLPPVLPLELPILINGQIGPGDVDRFRFKATRNQRLVIEAHARRLVPYLADAVPGWFQATLALYDADGNELAFTDDYRFDPDPVLLFKIPKTGEYELEIRDSIYRGREDFVYRIAVGQQPFITTVFPLGGRMGVETTATIDGWNLPRKSLVLDTGPEKGDIGQAALQYNRRLSNSVTYAVDTLPECGEVEPNDTSDGAQAIELPTIVNGRIGGSGDVDVFQFHGKAGEMVVAEVLARRLGSPLDSSLRMADAAGNVLEWNDDHEDKTSGLSTHHADSYVSVRLPTDGVYRVHVVDAQQSGGEAFGYRLRVGPPRPDFALRLTPASLNVRPGGAVPLAVYAVRRDGFEGEITLTLKNAPAGFVLDGARVPKGCDRVWMTLTAPLRPLDEPVVLQIEGRATIAGQTLVRSVVPAEDQMQAFFYRHLTPAQSLMVASVGRPGPPVGLLRAGPVRIPAGGSTQARLRSPRRAALQDLRLDLREAPDGLTLSDVTPVRDGVAFTLSAAAETVPVGFADNLIVEAYVERTITSRDNKAPKETQRVPLGVLPAIPFEIVQR